MSATTYETGKRCKRGHLSPRYVSSSNCVECARANTLARMVTHAESRKANLAAWRKANPDKLREWGKAWRQANPTKNAEYCARWERKHPSKIKPYRAQYRARNGDRIRAVQRVWREANRDYALVAAQKRRAIKAAAPGHGVTREERKWVMESALGLCAYCGERHTLTLDHIEPLVRGGEHDPDNTAAACHRCNVSKNDTPLLLWLTHLALRRIAGVI